MSTRLTVHCPVCGSLVDGHTSVSREDIEPADGDLSICVYCGALSTYLINDMGARLIEVPEEEAKELMKHPEIQKALAFIRALNASRG